MSMGAMMHVWWNSPSSGNDRLVLMAIADEADDQGYNASGPSVRRIAQKVNCHTATVTRSIEHLEAEGELEVVHVQRRGNGQRNRYRVVVQPLPSAEEIRSRYAEDHGESKNPGDNIARKLRAIGPNGARNSGLRSEEKLRAPVRADPKGNYRYNNANARAAQDLTCGQCEDTGWIDNPDEPGTVVRCPCATDPLISPSEPLEPDPGTDLRPEQFGSLSGNSEPSVDYAMRAAGEGGQT